MNKPSSTVSITGMGLISLAGMGIDPLWKACLTKTPLVQNGLGHVSLESNQEKALSMCLHAISGAMREAHWDKLNHDDAIVLGTTTGQISRWEEDLLSYSKGIEPSSQGKVALGYQPLSSLAEALKKALSFTGRVIILSSACSASTQALILGQQLLASGRARRCLAGGVEELGKLTTTGFGCLKLLNQEPCKPFDQDRSGINLSEGAAFYTLETSADKKALAHILGGDTVIDSYHMTSPNPEGMGLQKAILSAFERSGIQGSDIDFVHAHGTGSTHNDQSESFALKTLLPHLPYVVSTKGVHGHALGASGAIELGICLSVLKHNLIPPVTGLTNIDPSINLNLPQKPVEKKVKYILKTTLGFGGINSALILKAAHA